MPLVVCPDCDHPVSDSAPTCPHCGRPMTSQKTSTSPTMTAARPVKPGFGEQKVSKTIGCLVVLGFVVLVGVLGSRAPGCSRRSSPVEANGETKCWNDCLKAHPYPSVCPECVKGGRVDWSCIEVQGCKDAIGDICLKKCP